MQSSLDTTLNVRFFDSKQFNKIEGVFSENLGTYVYRYRTSSLESYEPLMLRTFFNPDKVTIREIVQEVLLSY